MDVQNETDFTPHITPPPEVNSHFQTNIVVSAVIVLFLVVGTTGSLTTAIVIGRTKSCHTKGNIFIFSLCVSDLISAIICSPLWLYRRTWGFEYWAMDEFICRFYWVIDFSTNYATSLHIASFSALRYAAIKWPFLVMKLSKQMVVGYILMLWFLSTIFSLPLGYLMGVDQDRDSADVGNRRPSCFVANKRNCCIDQFRIYINIVNSIMFYLPQFLIFMFSLLLGYEIKKNRRWRQKHFASSSSSQCLPISIRDMKAPHTTENTNNTVYCNTVAETLQNGYDSIPCEMNVISQCQPRDKLEPTTHDTQIRSKPDNRENGAFLQLLLITIAFSFGYIPITIYLQWVSAAPSSNRKAGVDYWFGLFSYLLLRLSECLNPFMYNLGSSNLRKETKKFLKGLTCCC